MRRNRGGDDQRDSDSASGHSEDLAALNSGDDRISLVSQLLNFY
jgi:hypothetical protein